MRIAFFVSSFPEVSETFILRQATGLLDRGHDVTIFMDQPGTSTVVHRDVLAYDLLQRTRDLSQRPPQEKQSAASLSRLATAATFATRTTFTRTPRTVAAALLRVVRLKNEPPADIVHCHYGDVGVQWGFAASLWRVPLVVSFYGYDCSELPARFGPALYRGLFEHAAVVAVLSRYMERQLLDLGCPPRRLRIQPLAVDSEAYSFRDASILPDQGTLRLLTVARLTEKKGLDSALRAVAKIVGRHPVTYEIIGDGPLRDDLQRLASTLGLENTVRFRGFLADVDVVEAMHRADLFLLPSTVASNGDAEGTPTVLLEAASTGLPVISTYHAGIPEVVTHGLTGLLVQPGADEELAAAIESLARDPGLRRRMGHAARRVAVEHFDVRAVSRDLEALYESVRA